jgi:hypothetical protein
VHASNIRFREYRLISVKDVQVEVIEHVSAQSPSGMSKDELKAFMVGLFVSLSNGSSQ